MAPDAHLATADASEALRRREDFERTLARFASQLSGPRPLDESLIDGLAALSRLTGAGRAYVFRIHDDGERMDNTHEWCAPGVEPQLENLQGLPCAEFPWWMDHLRRGELIHVRNVADMPPEAEAERKILEAQGIRSVIVCPVRVGERLHGFMGFDDVARADAWEADDLRLLELAGDILSNTLQRQEAERARQMSDKRLSLLVDQSPLSIQLLARDGTTLRVNSAWERLWGVTLDQLGGYNVLQDEQLREKGILDDLRRAFEGEAVRIQPVPYTPDRGPLAGRDIWVRSVAYPVKDERGEVREVVLLHEDITEQKHAEAELAASRRQVAMSEKLTALGALVSGVAHEIRTPLTYIANHLSLLDVAAARAPADVREKLREHVRAAQEGVDRVNALVQDLRGYARLPGVKTEPLELAEVVGRAVNLFRATHRGRIEVEELHEPSPAIVVVREQIEQVVLNLLNNASDAMQGKGKVRVSTRPTQAGVELAVEDEGPGVPEEALTKLFEPFFTTKAEGTGLGLSISRRLVEAHRGTIRYEPARAGGARFVATLPRT